MYCSNCGAQLADSANFCSSCGNKIAHKSPVKNAPDVPRPEAQSATQLDWVGKLIDNKPSNRDLAIFLSWVNLTVSWYF